MACGFDELIVGSGTRDRGLVEEFVVDEIAVAAAFVAFSANQALGLQERDRLGDGRRADLKVLSELGRRQAARVGGVQAGQHAGRHLAQP